MKTKLYGLGIFVAIVLFGCVLSFYQRTEAAPPGPQLPFANSVEQRLDMINQLKEVNAQLKELNALLRSGEVRVITRPEEKR